MLEKIIDFSDSKQVHGHFGDLIYFGIRVT
jgi:hypothetical protein